ncbi:MAG TPA: DsrE family protein [Methylomirabilota bacterium]|nr:DsrE family protein [Methylomirabilota bacterium]
MSGSQPTLVVISEDPRISHRANEAMRIALGIVAGDNEVRVVLSGPAVHLLDEDTDDLIDGDDIAKFRASLKKLGVPFHVEGALPTDPDWNADGHPVVAVSREEVAALVPRATRFLVF